jgi:hypothetical protein
MTGGGFRTPAAITPHTDGKTDFQIQVHDVREISVTSGFPLGSSDALCEQNSY